MKLDLSKVRIVSRDGDTTTLKHYAGHEIRIVHKALSRENKDALECLHKIHQEKQDRKESKRMAQGGEVNEFGIPDRYGIAITKEPAAVNKADTSANASGPVRSKNRSEQNERMLQDGKSVQEIQADEKANPMAKGGRVRRYADGGEVGPQEPSQRDIEAMINANAGNMQPQYIDQPQQQMQPPSMGQIAGDIGNVLMTPAGQPTAPIGQPRAVNPNIGLDPSAMPQMPNMGNNSPNIGGSSAQPQEMAPSTDSTGTRQYTKDMLGGIDMQKQALELQYKAAAQQGAARATADKTYIAEMQKTQADFNKFTIQNQQHIDDTIKDMQNHTINPKAYQENMTTGNKVATAIGMMAGGFGQAFVGGDNPAMTFLNKQIDRDISAQEKNQGQRVTLLNAYQNQFRNKMAATDMTKATLNSLYASQLSLAANQAATPQAKAAMLAGVGQLQMKSAELVKSATLNEYMFGMAGSGGANGAPADVEATFRKQQGFLHMVNPTLAKSREERHVPGIGDASVPVPDAVRKEFAAHQKLDVAAQDLYNFVRANRGGISTLHPELKAIGMQKALNLQALFREGTLNTVYREGEQPLLDKAVSGNPIAFYNYFTELPKIEEIMKNNAHAENSMRGAYGLPERQATNLGRSSNEGKTAVNARGERIIMKNGQWTPYGQ